MLIFKNPKSLATIMCVGALLTPLAPLLGSFAGPSHVAYAAVLPVDSTGGAADTAKASTQSLVVGAEFSPAPAATLNNFSTTTGKAKVGTQSLSVDAGVAPDPAPTFDSFWATPQKVLDHRAHVALVKKREKHADNWESNARKKIVDDGAQYIGQVPYVFGGESTSGWDCSGYTLYVLRETLGINVAHSVLSQRAVGHIVKKEDAKPGDLVVFSSASEDGFHVGIYLGDDKMEHAPQPGESTKISSIYWDPSNTVQFVNMLGLSPDAPAQLDHWDN